MELLKGSLMCTALFFGTAACTDDHFDIQSAPGMGGGQTLWQNIAANPELKSFAEILSRTTVLRTDQDKSATLKYSTYLNNPQYLTVWAPKDGTYNAQQWLDSLTKVEAIRAEAAGAGSERDSLMSVALNLEYKVGNQFVQNHIARFNFESNAGAQEVRMLNSKICVYDASNHEFNDTPLSTADGKIIASNGTMHLLEGASPFAYNLYDFMGAYPEYSSVYNYLKERDLTTFSPSASIEGAMDNNGQMQYADSVWITTNTVLTSAGASISNEDSLYVALIPAGQGWDQAVSKISSLFKYASSYKHDWVTSGFTKDQAINADSLCELNAKSLLVSSMFVTASSLASLPEEARKDSASLINHVLNADSLISTQGTVYYKQPGGVAGLTAGAKVVKASNGYVFPLEDYTIDPAYAWQERLTYTPYTAETYSSTTKSTLIYLSSDVKANDSIVAGELPDDYYKRYESESNKAVDVDFALNNVLSGKYRIKVYLLPSQAHKDYSDSILIGRVRYKEEINVTAKLILDNQDANGSDVQTSETVTVESDTIQAYTLINKKDGKDYFEFDRCYYGLPSSIYTFPRLRLSIARPARTSPANALNVGTIILEPVREEE